VKTLALLFLLGAFSEAADPRTALEAHQWFDLRDAVTSRKAPAFYRFFVAAAFNDERAAEKELRALTRSGVSPEQLADAHFALYRLHYRFGHYRKAIVEMRRVVALAPDRAPSEADKADAAVTELLPDTEVLSRRPAVVTYTNWTGYPQVVAPLTVNGQAAQFGIDTDAGISATTVAEAKRLGLRMMAGQASFIGTTGARATDGRYAVADRLRVGNIEIRNAAFLVLPDAPALFAELPLGQRGVIGLPVLPALQTIRWNRSHQLSIGFSPGRTDLRAANLAFEGLDPLTTVEVDGRRLAFDLDTVRYEQPETQMESTYVVTDSAHFGINFSSIHWKIEQMTDYSAYRHMLESFRFSK
jgi:hypothetical protein